MTSDSEFFLANYNVFYNYYERTEQLRPETVGL